MISTSPRREFPPRLGGQVTVIAEGRVNPGEVSGDGQAVVFGEFQPGVGESVFRWKNDTVEKLNTDGYSSFQAHSNRDASVVTYHRYSIPDAMDNSGNWDIARWEDGQMELVASTEFDEMYPDIDDSGQSIVHERMENKKASIVRWDQGTEQTLATVDLGQTPDAKPPRFQAQDPGEAALQRLNGGGSSDVTDGESLDLYADISGDGERIAFRRDFHKVYLHDQNGVTKPIQTVGEKPAGVTLDRSGTKVLYAANDEDGDQNLYLTDLSTSITTPVADLKGVDEYQGEISGDGKTVVYTGIDRRKGAGDMNVYLWRDGETKQLTWDDGGLNTNPSVSDDGQAVSWLWIDNENTSNRKVLLWQRD